MKTTTEAKARKVLALVEKQFKPWVDKDRGCQPELRMEWDGNVAILWESGAPHDWAMYFPSGGTEEEFGFKIKSVADGMPAGVFAEPANMYVLCLYPDGN